MEGSPCVKQLAGIGCYCTGRSVALNVTEAGTHAGVWNGRDDSGRTVANGVYFLRLEADGRTLTTKAVKVR